MPPPDAPRLDRRHLSVVKLGGKPDERAYWLSKTPAERLAALELLRQIAFPGYDPATTRLQRVLEIIQRPPR